MQLLSKESQDPKRSVAVRWLWLFLLLLLIALPVVLVVDLMTSSFQAEPVSVDIELLNDRVVAKGNFGLQTSSYFSTFQV